MSVDLRLSRICPSMCGVVNLDEKLKPCPKGQLYNLFFLSYCFSQYLLLIE